MRYMLDTNICIFVIKHKPEAVFRKMESIDPRDVCISSITYAELIHGVEKSSETERNRVALSLMLSNIEIEDFDVEAANCYGRIRADLESKGTPIGPLDTMIAAHAQSLGCTIVTNNVREFKRVKDLKIEDWTKT
ncbi:MAG: type II toxin-antitoxin system VapC family toxin [Clostridiales bacterium]|nr:type II toxin-antitoxin system VapC family toxin [Clostridiales bacterium]